MPDRLTSLGGGLADGSVTEPKLADGAVTSLKIADGTIVAGDLATNAVTTIKITDGSVTSAKLGSNLTLAGQTGIANGSVSAPGLAFSGDTNNGLYWIAENNWALSAGSAKVVDLTSSRVDIPVPIRASAGTIGALSYTFNGDENTGIYRTQEDQIGLVTGGSVRATVSSSGIGVAGGVAVSSGNLAVESGYVHARQRSLSNSSWAMLAQMDGTATGLRYLILAQSAVDSVADIEFYVLDNGTVRAEGTITSGPADYAEWFEHDAPMRPGDVVGFNFDTGKVRKYVRGDALVGVASEKAAFAAGAPVSIGAEMAALALSAPGTQPPTSTATHTLVGMIGQVDVDDAQIVEDKRSVMTPDRKRIGFRLSSGKVFLTSLGLMSLPGT